MPVSAINILYLYIELSLRNILTLRLTTTQKYEKFCPSESKCRIDIICTVAVLGQATITSSKTVSIDATVVAYAQLCLYQTIGQYALQYMRWASSKR